MSSNDGRNGTYFELGGGEPRRRVLDLSVDPAEFPRPRATLGRRRKARENARVETRSARAEGPRRPFRASSRRRPRDRKARLEGRRRVAEKREGPGTERLSGTETRRARRRRADGGPPPSPAARSVEALHAARAPSRRSCASAAARRTQRAATKEAARRRQRQVSSGSFGARGARGNDSSPSCGSRASCTGATRPPRKKAARVLAARRLGTPRMNRRRTRGRFPRGCLARARATKVSRPPSPSRAGRSATRRAKCTACAPRCGRMSTRPTGRVAARLRGAGRAVRGRGHGAGLERAGASFDEKASPDELQPKTPKARNGQPDRRHFGPVGAGRRAHATRQPWWPATFDDERAEAVRDAFESIAGAPARETLSRTLGKKTKSEIGTPGDTARLSSARARGTPASRLAKTAVLQTSPSGFCRNARRRTPPPRRARRATRSAAECTFQPRRVSRPTSSRPTSSRPRFSRSVSREAGDRLVRACVLALARRARAAPKPGDRGPAFAFSAVTGSASLSRRRARRGRSRAARARRVHVRAAHQQEFRVFGGATFHGNGRFEVESLRAELSVGDASERRRRGDENAAAVSPGTPRARGAERAAAARQRRTASRIPCDACARRTRAAARKSQTLGATAARVRMVPREMRARLARGGGARELSLGFARAAARAAVAKLKAAG